MRVSGNLQQPMGYTTENVWDSTGEAPSMRC